MGVNWLFIIIIFAFAVGRCSAGKGPSYLDLTPVRVNPTFAPSDSTTAISTTQVTFYGINHKDHFSLFGTSSKAYTTQSGSHIAAGSADDTRVRSEPFYATDPCFGVSPESSFSGQGIPADCSNNNQHYSSVADCKGAAGSVGAQGRSVELSYNDVYKKVFVIIWGCVKNGGNNVLNKGVPEKSDAAAAAKVYGPYSKFKHTYIYTHLHTTLDFPHFYNIANFMYT